MASAATLFALLAAAGCDGAASSNPPAVAAGGLDPSSEACAACHARHYDEWATSPHATSGTSEVFLALMPEVEATWGPAARAACEGCHNPVHEPTPRIGCVSCHSAVANRGVRDGLLVVDLSVPMARARATSDAPHPTRESALIAAPDLCGTCHEVTGPAHFVEPTFTEFAASPAAAAGATCQTCHMRRDTGGHTDHRFVGPDTRGVHGDEAVGALVGRALSLTVEPAAEGGVVVRLANTGAGHHVPTGATLLRDLWVDVEGASGQARRALTLGSRAFSDGAPVALATRADEVLHDTLAPGKTIKIRLTLAPPVAATLYLAPVSDPIRAALGLPEESPITVGTARLAGD